MSIWEFCIRRPIFTIMLVSAPVVLLTSAWVWISFPTLICQS